MHRLARAGLSVERPMRPFEQRAVALGLEVDVTNVGEALETLDSRTDR